MNYSPVIVVVAFNRPKSLERLLFSLKNAKKIENAKLIISIDNNEPENYNVRDMANAFNWPFGEKQVIYQEKRLGLKQHVLKCGDLASQYGSVIILEDDLFVSPYFYDYSVKALDYYDNNDQLGGISLYNHTYEDTNDTPFQPINDDSDVYFIQFPSSLGQAWTKKHWEEFRIWFKNNQDISNVPIHQHIKNWPETSWKKYYTAYLAATDKYFVFPRISLTSNFNDQGTHKSSRLNFVGQTQLKLSSDGYRFKSLSESNSVYDSHFELLPEKVKQFSPALRDYDFAMDLYGIKDVNQIRSPFILTSKPAKKFLWGYRRALKPHDMNVLLDLKGEDLVLCAKEDILPLKRSYKRELDDFKYFFTHRLIGRKAYIYNYLSKRKLFIRLFK